MSDLIITDRIGEWADWIEARGRRSAELEDYLRPADLRYHSYAVDMQALQGSGSWGVAQADRLAESPDNAIADIREALYRLDGEIPPERQFVRVVHVPRRVPIRGIRQDDIGRLVSVEGLVRKATEVRPRIVSAVFKCLECGLLTPPYAQIYGHWTEPYRFCSNCQKKTPLELVPEKSIRVDSQKVRIQESPEGLRGGEQPRTIDAELTADLAGAAIPGQRVILTGVLRATQKIVGASKSPILNLHIDAVGVEVLDKGAEDVKISEEDEAAIREIAAKPDAVHLVARSIAPSIWGYESVKTAIALQIFGGVVKHLPDGTRLRGDIHVLLVGDPGIAKSQMLKYVSRIVPRGISVSGKGSTAAGLTATAVKDDFGDGSWTLEAGALVLADGGMVCVDELDKMSENDRSALHDAMEQQVITITKAGINTSLRTRCPLLGAANPRLGRFNGDDPITKQINMPPSLLSRFDLLFVLTDKPDAERDAALARHISTMHRAGEQIARGETPTDAGAIEPPIASDLLQKYVALARRVTPVVDPEAQTAIENYYKHVRSLADENKPIPITPRQEDALFRLTEAAARMRLSEVATPADAAVAIRVLDDCLRCVAYDTESGTFDIDKWSAGISKKQRDVQHALLAAIDEAGSDGVAQTERVVEVMRCYRYGVDVAERAIRQAIEDGGLVELRPGLLKRVDG